jgi:hypothetical protein
VSDQTTIHPCEFCGEASVEEVVLVPSRFTTDKTGKRISTLSIKGWVCAKHKQHIEDADGWPERERARLAGLAKSLKRSQMKLGDAA